MRLRCQLVLANPSVSVRRSRSIESQVVARTALLAQPRSPIHTHRSICMTSRVDRKETNWLLRVTSVQVPPPDRPSLGLSVRIPSFSSYPTRSVELRHTEVLLSKAPRVRISTGCPWAAGHCRYLVVYMEWDARLTGPLPLTLGHEARRDAHNKNTNDIRRAVDRILFLSDKGDCETDISANAVAFVPAFSHGLRGCELRPRKTSMLLCL